MILIAYDRRLFGSNQLTFRLRFAVGTLGPLQTVPLSPSYESKLLIVCKPLQPSLSPHGSASRLELLCVDYSFRLVHSCVTSASSQLMLLKSQSHIFGVPGIVASIVTEQQIRKVGHRFLTQPSESHAILVAVLLRLLLARAPSMSTSRYIVL